MMLGLEARLARFKLLALALQFLTAPFEGVITLGQDLGLFTSEGGRLLLRRTEFCHTCGAKKSNLSYAL